MATLSTVQFLSIQTETKLTADQPELLPDGKSTTETVPGFAKKTTKK